MSTVVRKCILVTGSNGQLGYPLAVALREKMGSPESVICTDIREPTALLKENGPFLFLDVTNKDEVSKFIDEHQIDFVVHFAAVLSAVGEKKPDVAMEVNIRGTENILKICAEKKIGCFIPSSIAAFGPETPNEQTPDDTVQNPTTIYGVAKVYLEKIGTYFFQRFGVDFRSLRYPGIVGWNTDCGGGTTDWSVEMFKEVIHKGQYECFLKEDSRMPLMYMSDCIRGTVELIFAPRESLSRCVYNFAGVTFSPKDAADVIHEIYNPEAVITYRESERQKYADSWPRSINDDLARRDWHWNPEFDLKSMAIDILQNLDHSWKYTPEKK